MNVQDFRSSQKLHEELSRAYENSFYAICGAGGELQQWIDGYTKNLEEEGIGTPEEWLVVTGQQVNEFAGTVPFQNDLFQPDLTILLVSLEGLDVWKLAGFKLAWQDRWFDDIIDNMRRSYDQDD